MLCYLSYPRLYNLTPHEVDVCVEPALCPSAIMMILDSFFGYLLVQVGLAEARGDKGGGRSGERSDRAAHLGQGRYAAVPVFLNDLVEKQFRGNPVLNVETICDDRTREESIFFR